MDAQREVMLNLLLILTVKPNVIGRIYMNLPSFKKEWRWAEDTYNFAGGGVDDGNGMNKGLGNKESFACHKYRYGGIVWCPPDNFSALEPVILIQ
jgi:hypothetical protein